MLGDDVFVAHTGGGGENDLKTLLLIFGHGTFAVYRLKMYLFGGRKVNRNSQT
jgi:hypothetical protein